MYIIEFLEDLLFEIETIFVALLVEYIGQTRQTAVENGDLSLLLSNQRLHDNVPIGSSVMGSLLEPVD